MRYIICLLSCAAVIFITGCPDTAPKGTPRPVKMRLCSLVMIGNFGEEEINSKDDFSGTIFGALIPISEEYEIPEPDFSDALDVLNGGEEDEDTEDGDLTPEILGAGLSRGTQKPAAAKSDETPEAVKVRKPLTEQEINALCDRHLQKFLELNKEFLDKTFLDETDPNVHTKMTEHEVTVLCEHYLREFLKVNRDVLKEHHQAAMQDTNSPRITEQKIAEICERHLRSFLMFNDYLSDEPEPLTESQIAALREKHLTEFQKLNKYLSDEVQAEIAAANFQNYSAWIGRTFQGEYYAVRYFEYVGDNFALDYFQLKSSPAYKMWQEQQAEYIRPTSAPMATSDIWLDMRELFHCGEPQILKDAPEVLKSHSPQVPLRKEPSLIDVGDEEDEG